MNLSEPLPDEGIKVPIYVSFTGVKGVPLLTLEHNTLFPLLRFRQDEVELRVLRRHVKPWANVERVDIQKWKINTLVFDWRGSRFNRPLA